MVLSNIVDMSQKYDAKYQFKYAIDLKCSTKISSINK